MTMPNPDLMPNPNATTSTQQPIRTNMPPPFVFGFDPDKFPSWRLGQDAALDRILKSESRINVECLPTGSGKSLLGAAAGKLSGSRTVFLTRRKGLQSQMLRDFADIGMVDVRGQSSYGCMYSPSVSVELGPCHAGMYCSYRDNGCHYYEAVKTARQQTTPAVVTNYSFWFMQAKRGSGLGNVDFLVCDEAHGILEELSNFLAIEIHRSEIERLGLIWPEHYGSNLDSWKAWAKEETKPKAEAALEDAVERGKQGANSPGQVREKRRLETLIERLDSLISAQGPWVCDIGFKGGTLHASPIWPGPYVEKYLFQGAPKILMMSATIRPKHLHLLGIPDSKFIFNEQQSMFPLQNRMIYCPDAPRMNHRISEGEMGIWMDRIDQALERRLDRRVIVHVGSYERRNYIMTHSRWRQYMMGHDRDNLDEQIERFKTGPVPSILVSQSLTEGFDFSHDECRAQLIVKIPYPDSRDQLVKARSAEDKEYTDFIAMQTLVQTCGRNVRADDDWGENIVLDGNTKWFMKRNAKFAPTYFNQAVRLMPVIPQPPALSK